MKGPEEQGQDFPHGLTHDEWEQAFDDVREMLR